jgi:hypothetical protein
LSAAIVFPPVATHENSRRFYAGYLTSPLVLAIAWKDQLAVEGFTKLLERDHVERLYCRHASLPRRDETALLMSVTRKEASTKSGGLFELTVIVTRKTNELFVPRRDRRWPGWVLKLGQALDR